jgi:hypothetical protein
MGTVSKNQMQPYLLAWDYISYRVLSFSSLQLPILRLLVNESKFYTSKENIYALGTRISFSCKSTRFSVIHFHHGMSRHAKCYSGDSLLALKCLTPRNVNINKIYLCFFIQPNQNLVNFIGTKVRRTAKQAR